MVQDKHNFLENETFDIGDLFYMATMVEQHRKRPEKYRIKEKIDSLKNK